MSSTELGSLGEPGPQRESQILASAALDSASCVWLLSRVTGLFGPLSGAVDDTLLRGMLAVSCQLTGRERGVLALFDSRGRLLRQVAEGTRPPPASRLQELRTRREPAVELPTEDDATERLVVPIGPAAQPAQALLVLESPRRGAPVAAEALELAAALAQLIGGRLQEADERCRLREEVRQLRDQRNSFSSLVLASQRLAASRRKLRRAARHRLPVFLQGEDGTEKEELARFLHAADPVSASCPFAAVHAGSASLHHIEQELFAADPFTTLFVDHAELLPPEVQDRLAARLESAANDLRLVVGATRSLGELRRSTLQPALAEQLETRLVIPALRTEPAEIPSLVELILRDLGPGPGGAAIAISERAIKQLVGYRWRGNLRELRHVLENAAAKAAEIAIQPKHLPREIREVELDPGERFASLRDLERKHIEDVVAAVRSKREAAKVLGIAPSTLYEKLTKFEID